METRPRLSRALVASLSRLDETGVELPPAGALELPEKIVQFGTGAFLRGFVEYFVDASNRRGEFNGSVVAVSSTGSTRDAMLNEQDGLYTLAIQGVDNGLARQRYRVIGSLSRALSATDEWPAVLELARDPKIEIIVSNTTEIGIALDDADAFDAAPPKSFPAKLTRFLAERSTAFGFSGECGVAVLPCELVENNGDLLRRLVLELADRWQLGPEFKRWVADHVVFCNTLVDRIVPGNLPPGEAEHAESRLGFRDGLTTACEPYALFAIEGDAGLGDRLGIVSANPEIVIASDVGPYRERKVRVLNGAHTILVPVALLAGLETVRDACEDERVGAFLRLAMMDEIVPSLDAPNGEVFAYETLARFTNPYIRHALIDITLHATTKMRVRVVPSIVGFAARTGRTPTSLAFGFASFLLFMRGDIQHERRSVGLPVPEDTIGERVRAAWRSVDLGSDESITELARGVCRDIDLWGADLSAVPGFADAVAHYLVRIVRDGIISALDVFLEESTVTE